MKHALHGAEWKVIVAEALAALAARNTVGLARVGSALHGQFHQALRGDETARVRFVDELLRITDARAVRPLGRGLDAAARAVTLWQHLGELMQSMRQGVDLGERARIFVEERAHAKRVLELVKEAGPGGIEFGDLVAQLELQKSNVSRLAGEMEELRLIDRVRVGRQSVYMTGLQGSLLAEAGRERGESRRGLRTPKLFLCQEADAA